jgi:GLPGLI family protein
LNQRKKIKMKHLFKITFIALFLAQLSMAQTSRFVYQVTMKSDSTDKANATIETARLDISPEKSLFYGEGRIKRDSVMQRMRETRNFDRNAMQNLRSSIDYIVEKDLVKNITYFKTRLGRDQYTYEEDRKMDWKILPETVKIGEYEAQKAETTFAGRKWYAWFTQDIPFQDGPYKFKGLPGLIIKVEDANGDYSFDLQQSKKITEFPNFDNRGGNPIKVKRIDFEKQEKLYRKDPVSFVTNSFSQGGAPAPPQSMGGGNRGGGGGFRMDSDFRKQMEERLRDEVAKNNNPIELSK